MLISFIVMSKGVKDNKKIENVIVDYMIKSKREFCVLFFNKNSEEFVNHVKNSDSNSIYIIDLKMYKNFSGIDIAKFIRDYDWVSPIIMLSNEDITFKVFRERLQILDYVNKESSFKKNMFELFDICLKQLHIRNNFKYKIGKVNYSIDYNKILYFYKDTVERKSVLVTDNNEYKIPLNLVKIKTMLPEYFIITHKSCIVNSKRVDAYVWNECKIIFDNSLEISFLSKTHKNEIMIMKS